MSTQQRVQIKGKQKLKRRARRAKLLKKGLNPNDFFFGKFYVKPAKN